MHVKLFFFANKKLTKISPALRPKMVSAVVEDSGLKHIFEKYCQFGNRPQSLPQQSLASSPNNAKRTIHTQPQMDGMRFAKLIREANLMDPKLVTSVEVDIVFSKVKSKAERKISFGQFLKALELIGEKKFGDGGLEIAKESVVKIGGPSLSPGTTVQQLVSKHNEFKALLYAL